MRLCQSHRIPRFDRVRTGLSLKSCMLGVLGVLVLSLCLLPAGASASDGVYQPDSIDVPDGKAAIVLYRAFKLTGAAWPHRMFIDESEVVGLKSRFYTSILVSPGTHRVSVWPRDNNAHSAIDLVVESGQVAFVRYMPAQVSWSPGYPGSKSSLTYVSPDEAKADIAKRKYRYQKPDVAELASAEGPVALPNEVSSD